MTHRLTHQSNRPYDEPASDNAVLRDLSPAELSLVAGGLSADAGYGSSLGIAMTMVGGAIAAMAISPVIASSLALGSMGASVYAIYWGLKKQQ